MKKNLLIIAFGSCSILQTMAQTLILQPDGTTGKDAFMNELYPETNFGEYEQFISYDWTFSGVEGLGNSLMQFDISSIPPDCIILDAELSLFHNPASGSAGQAGNNACYLKQITSSWEENEVTWATAPTTSELYKTYLKTSTAEDQNYPTIDLTQLVQNWYTNPSENYGMMIQLADAGIYESMKFCSSDYPDETKRPRLEVHYTSAASAGIQQMSNNPSFHVYPNPAKDLLTVEKSVLSEDGVLTICDAKGNELIQQPINDKSLVELTTLTNGVYFVKVTTDSLIEVQKIVKE